MLLRQRPNDPDFAMNLIYFFLSIQCLTKAMVAIYNSLVHKWPLLGHEY